MKFPKLPFQMMRTQFIGLGILGILILILQIFFYYQRQKKGEDVIQIEVINNTGLPTFTLSEFNPNDLSEEDWQKLGFTAKQAKTILNYKDLVGGSFSSKEQLAKCYAISADKFAQLEKYILLPEKNTQKKYQFNDKKELDIRGKFNPDDYKVEDWMRIGFTQKQAEAIIKYKNYLGGSFVSKEKVRECFVISPENYKKLSPYLLLPENTPKAHSQNEEPKSKIQYTYFDPNSLDTYGWQKLGFSEKQAQAIVNYRERNLKGSFKTLEDIQKCFVISDKKFEELRPWIKIVLKKEEEKKVVEKQDAKTDFSKVDLNAVNFKQLVEFGFSEKAARSFLGFRKRLGGFVTKQQVLEVYHIDSELAKKLLQVVLLDISKIHKYTLKDAPEDVLKNHPYFRKYGDRIIYYRVSFNEQEVFKKINATPEEVAKMKMYLK